MSKRIKNITSTQPDLLLKLLEEKDKEYALEIRRIEKTLKIQLETEREKNVGLVQENSILKNRVQKLRYKLGSVTQ